MRWLVEYALQGILVTLGGACCRGRTADCLLSDIYCLKHYGAYRNRGREGCSHKWGMRYGSGVSMPLCHVYHSLQCYKSERNHQW